MGHLSIACIMPVNLTEAAHSSLGLKVDIGRQTCKSVQSADMQKTPQVLYSTEHPERFVVHLKSSENKIHPMLEINFDQTLRKLFPHSGEE
jgi:hypothetical protein